MNRHLLWNQIVDDERIDVRSRAGDKDIYLSLISVTIKHTTAFWSSHVRSLEPFDTLLSDNNSSKFFRWLKSVKDGRFRFKMSKRLGERRWGARWWFRGVEERDSGTNCHNEVPEWHENSVIGIEATIQISFIPNHPLLEFTFCLFHCSAFSHRNFSFDCVPFLPPILSPSPLFFSFSLSFGISLPLIIINAKGEYFGRILSP